jgi:hypothetical protein
VIDLADGVHTIILRARALGNDWYEVSREVKVSGVPDNRRDVDVIAAVLVIVIMIMIILVSVYLALSRKRRRSYNERISAGDDNRIKRSLEEEVSVIRREPHQEGPRSPLEEEYELVNREALTWKRPSRFTMERNKMYSKLRMKLDDGEIDEELHRELSDFIDHHFPEGRDRSP